MYCLSSVLYRLVTQTSLTIAVNCNGMGYRAAHLPVRSPLRRQGTTDKVIADRQRTEVQVCVRRARLRTQKYFCHFASLVAGVAVLNLRCRPRIVRQYNSHAHLHHSVPRRPRIVVSAPTQQQHCKDSESTYHPDNPLRSQGTCGSTSAARPDHGHAFPVLACARSVARVPHACGLLPDAEPTTPKVKGLPAF